jgi:hypothetical protein
MLAYMILSAPEDLQAESAPLIRLPRSREKIPLKIVP